MASGASWTFKNCNWLLASYVWNLNYSTRAEHKRACLFNSFMSPFFLCPEDLTKKYFYLYCIKQLNDQLKLMSDCNLLFSTSGFWVYYL